MHRRSFLQLLGLAATGAALGELDYERALWVPGAKTHFLLAPADIAVPEILSGNQLLTIEWITRDALRIFENQLVFAKHVNRQYDRDYPRSGASIGSIVSVRRPSRLTISNA